MKIIVTVIIMLILALFLQEAIRIAYLFNKASKLEKNQLKFSTTAHGSYTILVIGDRNSLSIGLEDPGDSLLGQLFKELKPANLVIDGTPDMGIEDLNEHLSKHVKDTPDIVLLIVGENDILRQKKPVELKEKLDEALDLASQLSNGNVVLIGPRNIGSAPIMPPIMPKKYTKLTQEFSNMYADSSDKMGVEFLSSHFVGIETPEVPRNNLYLPDQFHLSKYGYKIWADGILMNSDRLRVYE